MKKSGIVTIHATALRSDEEKEKLRNIKSGLQKIILNKIQQIRMGESIAIAFDF